MVTKAQDILNKDSTSIKVNVEDLKKKANDYVGGFAPGCFAFGEATQILTFIYKVINAPEFQTDPQAYLKRWKLERGGSEEFRVEEDNAMAFFEQQFKF